MGMSNVLTADPRIPRTKLSSVDVDVRTVKDWTDWSTSSKDSVALCEIWLGEQGKPIYSSRSKEDPHKDEPAVQMILRYVGSDPKC